MTLNVETVRSLMRSHRRVLNRLEPGLGCVVCRGPLTGGVCPVCDPAPTDGPDGRYRWDWVNTGDEVYDPSSRRRIVDESYVVRKPDGSILCFTNRSKDGWEKAVAIADAMNAQVGANPG